jgi:hypothetical protein
LQGKKPSWSYAEKSLKLPLAISGLIGYYSNLGILGKIGLLLLIKLLIETSCAEAKVKAKIIAKNFI